LLLLDLVIKGCWYNEHAENIFNEKAEEFLKTLFVKITVIAITNPKNRWGNIMNEETCRVNINVNLLKAPKVTSALQRLLILLIKL